MQNQSSVRLTGLFNRARMVFSLRDLYIRDAMTRLAQRPAATVMAALALVTPPLTMLVSPFLPVTQQAHAAAAATTAQKPALGTQTVSIDADSATAPDRAAQAAALEKIIARPVLQKNDIRALQAVLNDQNHNPGPHDGLFGARTARSTIAALTQHPQLLAKLSPFVLENLMFNGQRQELKTLLQGAPEIRASISALIDNPAATVRSKQAWLAAYGLYNDEIDNIRGTNTIAAENAFRAAPVAQAKPPAPTVQVTPAPQVQAPTTQSFPQTEATFGKPLSRSEILQLETILTKGGYYHGRPSGEFRKELGNGLIEYLRDHQDQLPELSPWVLQKMIGLGYQADLKDMMFANPAVKRAVTEKIRGMSGDAKSLNRNDLAELQVWLKVTGLYNAPVNGVHSAQLESAIRDFNDGSRKPSVVTVSPVDTASLAANSTFRAALRNGDMKTVVRVAESLDTAPLKMHNPLMFMNKISDYQPLRKTRLDRHARPHMGTDYSAPSGTRIFAPADGVVAFTGVSTGYGETVILDHGHGVYTMYAHLSKGSIAVKPGQLVATGQKLGAVGETGNVTGAHLHYEIIIRDRQGTPISINAHRFAHRNLKDRDVQLEAIADARVTMRPWAQSATHSTMAHTIPADKPAMTASVRDRLLQVFAADRALYSQTSERITTALRTNTPGNTFASLLGVDIPRVTPAVFTPR